MPSGEKFVLTAALQGKLDRAALGRIREELFEDAACRALFSVTKGALLAGQAIDFAEVQTHLKGEAELTLLSELTLTEEIDDSSLARMEEVLQPMERNDLDRRRKELQRGLVEAERIGDAARVDELVRMYSALK
jgi:hypothetical protein